MDITLFPGRLHGTVSAIPSKSHAHRLLICAAFSDSTTYIECPDTNQDIEATVNCLNAIGAEISRNNHLYIVRPVAEIPLKACLDCRESGSTLRFMLPIVCALGIETTIHMCGRLPLRPLSPMWEELERMGCTLTRPTENTIQTYGKLHPGEYTIAGNVSSQFITGLLFALSLLKGNSVIHVTEKLESKPYIAMTQIALQTFGISTDNFRVSGNYPFHSPGKLSVEGDWSNAAFFLTAAAMGNEVNVSNLNSESSQGDRAILDILAKPLENPNISMADIPDLMPILAVYFATKGGVVFTDIERLRLKESDRVVSVSNLLHALGIHAEYDTHTMKVYPGQFSAGTVDSCCDHRIAMAASIAATVASGPVTILGAECVGKSYPAFWREFQKLGGHYEQHIR